MSHLLYCIVRGDRCEPFGAKVPIMVRRGGLAAVVRNGPHDSFEPATDNLIEYANVVECYDRDESVIPMRFGCVFDRVADIAALLEQRQLSYRDLLSKLNGRTEMTVRALVQQQSENRARPQSAVLDGNNVTPANPQALGVPSDRRSGAGMRYLASRRHHYEARQTEDRARDELSRDLVSIAAGTFVQWKSEYVAREGQAAIEVHFLVSREGVQHFRNAFDTKKIKERSDLTVSGPWPAYNFVQALGDGLLRTNGAV